MSENKHKPRSQPRRGRTQAGAFAVEFALVLVAYLTLMFCVIEVSRAVYLWNTLQEVTRRAASAAASTDFSDASANDSVRQHAIFRNSPGLLAAGAPVTDAHIRIDYMSLARAPDGTLTLTAMPAGAVPASPARNQVICAANPNNASCIRFVRVRVCEPGGDPNACDPVQYVPILPLITVSSLKLPPSTTIAKAETLGYEPGQPLGQ